MTLMPRWRGVLIVLMLGIWLSGCAGHGGQIAVDRTTCCEAELVGVETYTLVIDDMPAFLEPFFVDGLVTVLHGKGLSLTETGGDVVVRLRYDQLDIDTRQPIEGRIWESETDATVRPRDGDLRSSTSNGGGDGSSRHWFLPRVHVTLHLGESEVWHGVLSRVHQVGVGDYMHEQSRDDIRLAFAEVFNDFPVAGTGASAD